MTIKELAQAAGCNEKTVRRIAQDAIPGKIVHGKVTRFTWDEANKLMILLPKKNLVEHSGQLSTVFGQMSEVSTLTAKDMDLISRLTAGIVTAVMANLDQRVQKIETRVEQRQALLPAPQIKPRDRVNKIVREYAEGARKEHRDVWKELYREFGYRTNTNPSLSAKNRGMAVIDYIDAEGQIDTLEAVALDLWGPK